MRPFLFFMCLAVPLLSVASVAVPRTGQTTCSATYAPSGRNGEPVDCSGTGQDGELRLGEPFPTPRFSDMGDGTVLDNATGLMWLRDATCLWANYPGDFPTTRLNWEQALEAVQAMSAGSYPLCGAGHSDWRLPNRNELATLASFQEYNPALAEGHPFQNAALPPFNFWSSTSSGYVPDEPNKPYAHYLHLYDGMLDSTRKHDMQWVWPVRGGILGPVNTGDGGVGQDGGSGDGGAEDAGGADAQQDTSTSDGGDGPAALDAGPSSDSGSDDRDGGGCSCRLSTSRRPEAATLALVLVPLCVVFLQRRRQ